MKDLIHHLKYVQKKIIASSRKENANNEIKDQNNTPLKFSQNNKKKAYES